MYRRTSFTVLLMLCKEPRYCCSLMNLLPRANGDASVQSLGIRASGPWWNTQVLGGLYLPRTLGCEHRIPTPDSSHHANSGSADAWDTSFRANNPEERWIESCFFFFLFLNFTLSLASCFCSPLSSPSSFSSFSSSFSFC